MPFIVFEGVDHAGKGTQITLLERRLKHEGHDVLLTREPGDAGVIGASLRELMSSTRGITPVTRAFLMAADCAQQMHDVVKPALEEGKIVISDRFTFSSWAYQGAHGIDDWTLQTMSELATGETWPDLTIYLDLEPEAWETRKKADDPDKDIELSSIEFLTKVRELYIERVVPFMDGSVYPINANQTREKVHEEIWNQVQRLLA